MSALDPKGTCHLVGCPGKGQHAPHGIGAPSEWPSDGPTARGGVIVPRSLLHEIRILLRAARFDRHDLNVRSSNIKLCIDTVLDRA